MMKAPFQGYPPELLAQIAQGAFRPPQAMGMQAPGMGMQAPQQGGGADGLGAGMAGLGMGLGMLGKMGGGNISEQGAVGPGGLAGAVSSIDALKPGANGQWAQPAMPTNIGYGQGGGNDFWSWLPWR